MSEYERRKFIHLVASCCVITLHTCLLVTFIVGDPDPTRAVIVIVVSTVLTVTIMLGGVAWVRRGSD